MALVERFRHHEVEAIRVGRFGSRINTSCILYRLGDTLIDTGPSNQWRTVRRFIEERALARVLITHHHEDHSGNFARIGENAESTLICPAQAVERVREGFPLRFYQKVIWGRPGPAEATPATPAIPLETSGLELRMIHTPGHSSDMTCYLEPHRGWLFSGDLYVSGKTRYLRQDEDLEQQIFSLRSLAEKWDFEILFCAHRGMIRDGKRAVRDKLDWLLEFCGRVRDLRRQGLSRKEIRRRLLGRETWMTWFTGHHFSKQNLIEACLDLDRPGSSANPARER